MSDAPQRRVAVVKKSSLAGLSEGWGDECFALVRLADYQDMQRVQEFTPDTPSGEQWTFQQQFIREHFVSGKVKIFNDKNEQVEADMLVEDCLLTMGIANKVFQDIIGMDLDPKDLAAIAAQQKPPGPSNASTGTSSSEASAPTSPQPSTEK